MPHSDQGEVWDRIRKLQPDWHQKDDDNGVMKIAMTGSASDPLECQDHIRNKPQREGASRTGSQTGGSRI